MTEHKVLDELKNGMLQIEITCYCGKKEVWNTPVDSDWGARGALIVVPPLCEDCRQRERKSEEQR